MLRRLSRGPLAALLVRFAVLALIYTLLRAAFVLLNRDSFPNAPFAAFWGGIRFDLSALAWLNLPWVLLFLARPKEGGLFGAVKRFVFHLANAAGFFFACTDLAYYKFTLKRSTADLFGIMAGGGDVGNLAGAFVTDYWHIVLLFLGCVALAELGYRWGGRLLSDAPVRWPQRVGWRLAAAALLVMASRGGVQLIPIGVMNAADHVPPPYFPVVLNTPFTIMTTLGKPVVEPMRLMPQAEADRLWPVEHDYSARADSSDRPLLHARPNVVLIILESFSAQYSARLAGGEGHMPFLDSLMAQSLTFTRAYANGRRSIDGIPAITAALPELMDEAFITSSYAQSAFTSLAGVLGRAGYATSFHHGGRNGTMGFDSFARSAGYARYAGMNEYPRSADYDGAWGIWDRPYLAHFAQELGKEQQPFFSTVFTLSSHHPYRLPEAEAHRFTGGTLPIHASLRYADDALRRFFADARLQPWFGRTLFVITADHTADLDRSGQHYSEATDYWVPLLFHMPAAIAPREVDRVTQHIDILPTVLDLLGHAGPFFSFGASALREERLPVAVTRTTGRYLIIDADGAESFSAGELERPAASNARRDRLRATLAAAVQQFNNRMSGNRMTSP